MFLSKSKPFVTIRSDDPINPAVIVWNDTAATPGKDGKPLGADGSSTVTVESDYFIASHTVSSSGTMRRREEANKGNLLQLHHPRRAGRPV